MEKQEGIIGIELGTEIVQAFYFDNRRNNENKILKEKAENGGFLSKW
jgi:hypothetical protein